MSQEFRVSSPVALEWTLHDTHARQSIGLHASRHTRDDGRVHLRKKAATLVVNRLPWWHQVVYRYIHQGSHARAQTHTHTHSGCSCISYSYMHPCPRQPMWHRLWGSRTAHSHLWVTHNTAAADLGAPCLKLWLDEHQHLRAGSHNTRKRGHHLEHADEGEVECYKRYLWQRTQQQHVAWKRVSGCASSWFRTVTGGGEREEGVQMRWGGS